MVCSIDVQWSFTQIQKVKLYILSVNEWRGEAEKLGWIYVRRGEGIQQREREKWEKQH